MPTHRRVLPTHPAADCPATDAEPSGNLGAGQALVLKLGKLLVVDLDTWSTARPRRDHDRPRFAFWMNAARSAGVTCIALDTRTRGPRSASRAVGAEMVQARSKGQSSLLRLKPIRRAFLAGGSMSWRIASNTTLNWASYLCSSCAILRARAWCDDSSSRSLMNARTT